MVRYRTFQLSRAHLALEGHELRVGGVALARARHAEELPVREHRPVRLGGRAGDGRVELHAEVVVPSWAANDFFLFFLFPFFPSSFFLSFPRIF